MVKRIAPTVLSIHAEVERWQRRAIWIDRICAILIAAGIGFMLACAI